jgi:hypothetical protein
MMAIVDGPDFNGVAELDCLRCKGAGEVDEDMERWMKIGGVHRTWRVAQWESLADCSKRLGIGAADLSAMEQGRKDPTRLIADIPAELQPRI